jgi:hypothetical protein
VAVELTAEGFILNSSINISNTAAIATTVTFDTPAYCKSGKDYCIVIIPDQFSPNFLLWVAETGLPDIANNNLIATTNWGSGSLFLSQNDSVWTPYQSEDLKFTLTGDLFSLFLNDSLLKKRSPVDIGVTSSLFLN